MIVSRIDRLARLLRRLRVDRRLPPAVTKMASRMAVARWTRWRRRLSANVLVPVGDSGPVSGTDYWLGRRVRSGAVSAELRPSPSEFAAEVQRRCAAVGIACVAVDSTPTEVRLAVEIEDRGRLWDVVRRWDGSAMLVASWRNGRPRVVSRLRRRRATPVTAPVWLLLRPTVRGDEINTRWCRVEVTFWELGASGQREMVGVRHNERFDEGAITAAERVGDTTLTVFAERTVGDRIDRVHQPIDIVFTWVNSGDPAWRRRMLGARNPGATDEVPGGDVDWERYDDNDELRYALRSVADFAPWARHIWLVTDDQRPDWLGQHRQISVVDHRVLFGELAPPVFNSHAIEAVLHRIPGLADRFLYFNDDFFLGRPLDPSDFFASDQVARVFPSDAPVPVVEVASTPAVDTSAIRGNEVLQNTFGRRARFKLLHSPYPLFRSVLEEIEDAIPQLHARTAASQFRSSADLSIPSFLAPYWSVERGRGVISTIDNRYVNIESPRMGWVLDPVLQFGCDTVCLNQTASGSPDSAVARRLVEFLEAMYPNPAPWEHVDKPTIG